MYNHIFIHFYLFLFNVKTLLMYNIYYLINVHLFNTWLVEMKWSLRVNRKRKRDDNESRCSLMRSRENPLRRVSEHDVNAAIRCTHTASIYGARDRETRGERRDETRRGESYSAGLTAQARRESCQFRSDPRVRVPETAGLALVSTRISRLSARLDYGHSLGGISSDGFSRFFSSANATRPFYQRAKTDLPFVRSPFVADPFTVTRVSNFRYPCLAYL